MAENTSVVKMNTAVSQWSNSVTDLVKTDFEVCGVPFDEYSKACAMSAMTNIFEVVKSAKVDLNSIDTSNLREVVGQVASLKLNANAMPRECYFTLRSYQGADGEWRKKIEMGIEGDGNDALLRQFGEGVDMVYPVWIVKEGDSYTPPRYKGIEIEPPVWAPKGLSERAVRVVYPVKMTDGTVQYLVSERESVQINLIAHVRNNLTNETFGIAKSRYGATDNQKIEIDAKKDEILSAIRACNTVDEILACDVAKKYISPAWLDTPESMIVRKMRNNAIKKFKKNYNSMAQKSVMQLDETYQQVQEDIQQNANSVPFDAGEVEVQAEVVEPTVEKVDAEVVEDADGQVSMDDLVADAPFK